MKKCIYCNLEKPDDEFSDEHIWPRALGGDYLPSHPWRTSHVCAKCNSMSGVFVDGAFIRSFSVKAEFSHSSLEYLAAKKKPSPIPLIYAGRVKDIPIQKGEVAEFWAGPCGENIIHIRPDDDDEQWQFYAGGDPRVKKAKAGRAYMALTSENRFWTFVGLESFRKHFEQSERFVVNMDIPDNWPFKCPDQNDPVQAADMRVVNSVISASKEGRSLHMRAALKLDSEERFLAKLALAVGFQFLGFDFLKTDYAMHLRKAFREADYKKSREIPISVSGFLSKNMLNGAEQVPAWPGGWVLLLKTVEEKLALTVVSPSEKSMGVIICDQADLLVKLDSEYKDGLIWVTVPAAEVAVGPIPLPEYKAHQTACLTSASLKALAAMRGDPKTLPEY